MPVRLIAAREPLSANTFALTAQVVYDPLPLPANAGQSGATIAATPTVCDLSLVFDPAPVLAANAMGNADHTTSASQIGGVMHTHFYWSDVTVPALAGGATRVLFERSFVIQASASVAVSFVATPANGGARPDTVQSVAATAIDLPI